MSVCGSTETTTGEPCQQPVADPNETCWRESHTPGPGRPTKYDADVAEHICQEIAKGRSLKSVCREEGVPGHSTVLNWVSDDRDGFSDRYAHACQIRLHVLSEELLEISDDGRNDTYVDEEGREHTDYDVIQRSKLRVDTRKWLLSKLKPEKYGKRQRVEHSGPEGGPIEHRDVSGARERVEQLLEDVEADRRAERAGSSG